MALTHASRQARFTERLRPNGDAWCLIHNRDTGRVLVRHLPNLPSGGQVSDIELGDFLARGAAGPEHQALIRLIGGLADAPSGD